MNRLITYLIVALCLITQLIASGQTIPGKVLLSGVIMDSLTQEPIPYASITVIPIRDSARINEAPDKDGNFRINLTSNNKYVLIVSCLGMKSRQIDIQLYADPINLGQILLRQDISVMNEVVISAQRKRIQLTDAGFTYSLKEDPTVASENLLFALRKVPLVNVDGEGRIQVRGSGDYTIYLNGKPYSLANANPKEILQSIPASSIEKVEVITNLDSRHDGASGGSILNIITSRKRLDGYQVILNASGATYPSGNAGATFLFTKNKISASVGYSYNEMRILDVPGSSYRENYGEGKIVSTNTSNSIASANFKTHTARALLEYNIDTLNTLYTDGNLMFQNQNTQANYTNSYIPTDRSPYLTRTFNDVNLSSGASEFNISYRNLYPHSKKERVLVAYRYTYNPDNRGNDVIEHRFLPGVESFSSTDYTEYKHRSVSGGGLNEHTFQLDYTLPIQKRHSLSIGIKEVYRNTNSGSEYYKWNSDTQAWENGSFYPHDKMMDCFKQQQNIAAAYVSYKYTLGKFYLNAGVRGEYTTNQVAFPDSPGNNYTSRNFDVIPRINLTYNLSGHSQFALSYSSRIRRPSIWQMNPYREQLDEFRAEYGNPDLKSEQIHEVSLSYNYFSEKTSLALWTTYSDNNNVIVKYPSVNGDDKKIIEYTYGNLGKYRKILGGFYLSYSPVVSLKLSANGTLSGINMKSKELNLEQNTTGYSLSVSCDWHMGKYWYTGANWAIFQQDPEMQISYNHFQRYSWYLKKGFLENKLSLTFNIDRPFDKYRLAVQTVSNPEFLHLNNYNIISRNFTLSLSYSFGSGKATAKRKRNIENNDLMQRTGVE